MRCFIAFVFILFTASLAAQKVESKKNGKVTVRNVAGIIIEEGMVKKHLREGVWTKYYDTGERKESTTYLHGVMNGPFYSYMKSGKIEKEGVYTKGLATGEWKIYNFRGDLSYLKQYDTNGKLLVTEKHAYGKLQERQVTNPDGSVYTEEYHVDGSLHKRYTKLNGRLEGAYYEYSYEPQRKAIVTADDTLPVKIFHYHNGRPDGRQAEWKKVQGKRMLISETWYKNNQKDSIYRLYFPSEHILQESYYKNGKKEGQGLTYTDSVLTGRTWFTAGEIDSSYQYYKDGKIKETSTKDYRRKYYPDGKLEEEVTLGKWGVEGPVTAYYPNGKKKYELNYSRRAVNGEWKAWNENGVMVIRAWADHFIDTLEYVYSDKGKKLAETDPAYSAQLNHYMPGMMVPKGQAVTSISEEMVQEGEAWEEGYEEIAPTVEREIEEKAPEVLTFAEQMPEFPGGQAAYQEYLAKNIVYPQTEREAGKQGTVYVTFTVQRDGKITDVKAVKEVPGAPGFTKEAIRVFSGMPNWEPGKMNGRPVAVSVTYPVRFKMD